MGFIEDVFQKHMYTTRATVEALVPAIEKAGQIMIDAYRKGGKVLLFGNGGSSTDALHIEGELLGRFGKDRPGLPAIALGGGIAALTAVSNDYEFKATFARFLRAQVKPEDIALLYSTSGNSPNIVEAAMTAAELGIPIISFTGNAGGKLKKLSTVLINIPSEDTPRIQEMHITISHILCQIVEESLF